MINIRDQDWQQSLEIYLKDSLSSRFHFSNAQTQQQAVGRINMIYNTMVMTITFKNKRQIYIN